MEKTFLLIIKDDTGVKQRSVKAPTFSGAWCKFYDYLMRLSTPAETVLVGIIQQQHLESIDPRTLLTLTSRMEL